MSFASKTRGAVLLKISKTKTDIHKFCWVRGAVSGELFHVKLKHEESASEKTVSSKTATFNLGGKGAVLKSLHVAIGGCLAR